MNDTPENIKALQLKIWLSKSPGERLRQFMEDNASLFQFWWVARKSDHKLSDSKPSTDFIMEFSSGIGKPSGLCRVRTFDLKKQNNVVIITDIGDLNPGASVTNSIKQIVSKLISEKIIASSNTIIEHNQPHPFSDHTFEIVTFNQEKLPSWESIGIEHASDICEIKRDEICSLVEDDKKLMKEIVIQTNLIIQKKGNNNEEIVKDGFKIYLHEIRTLIKNQALERDFQIMLKKDLSLIAEVYADPKDEYICFSEFPIGKRKADFVLFTGRSKMSVYVIEIKGADFFFSNKRSYKKVNEKISTCRHQVIENINEVSGQYYEEFREFCHKIRLNVENGNTVYNSFMGHKKHLDVDEKKEIKIFGVIIGGRIRNDLYESNIRHHEENLTPKIRIESWDSWLNKLTRPENSFNNDA